MKAHEILMRLTAIGDFSDIQNNTKTLQEALNKLQVPKKFKDSFNDIFKDLEKEVNKYQKTLDSGLKTKGDLSGLEKSGEKIINLFSRLEKQMGQISTKDLEEIFEIDPSTLAKAKKDIEEVKARLEKAFASGDPSRHLADITKTIEDLAKISKAKDLSKLNEAIKAKDFEEASKALEKLSIHADRFKEGSSNKEKWTGGVAALKTSIDAIEKDPSLLNIYEDLRKVKLAFDTLEETEFNQNAAGLNDAKIAAGGLRDGINQLHNQTVEAGASALNFSNTLDHFKDKAAYFFGIANSIELFKRAVRDAYESVKELDKVMTETAVVTDFTVGDMWEQLPEYSKRASELGVSIKGAYESATLYYQQGLKTDEVIAASSETLKMARIAGMDYAEATNYMTAALRGFNMEINEQSAQRVNDVYSELAAITASDTEEISKAMTKTASIADSANMEFETTAAFLAQIIETTREAPETAGTALKTVIARFQELKKDPAEIGEVEGEIVDANKIETALRTIDVALRDTKGQFRDLDDVFLEIASKWDTLDLNTQRYIATMAAGSRQQSRFLAMMSDYGRTMELVNAANNSAGASQEQFEKTLDSLESKIARLDNAWTNFTMGITNNVLVKTGVDTIYGLVEAINKMTDILPGGAAGVAKLGLSLAALKTGGNIFDNIFKNFKEQGKDKAPFERMTGTASKSLDDFGKYLNERTSTLNKQINLLFDGKVAKDSFKEVTSVVERYKNILAEGINEFENFESFSQRIQSSQNELAALLGNVSNSQEIYNKALSQGIELDQIAVTLSSPSFKAKMAQILANKELSQEERESAIAREFLNAVSQKGIAISIKDSIAKTKIGLANKFVAGTAAEAATWTKILNGALSKVGLTIPGAIALAGAFMALGAAFIYVKNNSPEGKFKKASEAASLAAEEAAKAKEAYDTLLSGKENYNSLEEKLDSLTEGTSEWKQALFEANQQVLELLENYNNLKVENQDGKLVVTNWDEVFEEQFKQFNAAQVSSAAAAINQQHQEINVKKHDVLNALPQMVAQDSFYTQGIRQALENGDIEELTALRSSVDSADERFIELNQALDEYLITQNKINNAPQQMASALYSSLDDKQKEFEYSNIVVNKVAELSVENQEKEINKEKSNLGYNIDILRSQYRTEYGKDADKELTREQLRELIATARVGEKAENRTKDLINHLVANEDDQKVIAALLSEGNALRRGEAETLELTESALVAIETTLGEYIPNAEELLENIKNNNDQRFSAAKNSAAALVGAQYNHFGEATNQEGGILTQADVLLNKANAAQYEGYMNNLTVLMGRAAAKGGEQAGIEAGNYLNNTLKKLLNGRSQEEQDRILNAFAAADLRTETGIKNFIEGLDAVGIEMSRVDMNQLIDDLSELGNAVKDVNLDNLLSQVKSLRDLADSIRDRELNEGITQEEYEQIIKDGAAEAEDFYFTGQEFIYLGDSMETLADALIKVSNEALDGVIPALEDQINSGNATEKALESEYVGRLSDPVYNRLINGELDTQSTFDYLAMQNFLGEYFTQEGKGRSVVGMDKAAMTQAYLDAIEAYNNRATNQAQLDEKQVQVSQAQLHGMSAVEIAASGYDSELIDQALDVKVATEGLDATYLQLEKDLKKLGKDTENYKAVLIDLASKSKTASQNQKALADAISENKDALKKPGTTEYTEALQEITEKAKNYFGEGITAEFVDGHLKDFLLLAQGGEAGEEAYYRLGAELGKSVAKGFGADAEKIIGIAERVIGDIPTDIEIGGTFDFSDILQAMNITAAEAKKLQDYLNTIGFSTSIEYEYGYEVGGAIYTEAQYQKLNDVLKSGARRTVTGIKAVGTKEYDPTTIGSGYKGGSSSKWENPYDKQYNTLEDINEAQRERNKLEKELNLLKAKGEADSQDYIKTYQEIYANLEKQKALQKKLREGRKQELEDLQKANAAYQKYAVYDAATQTIDINWTELNKVKATDEKTGKAIENYISELERITSSLEDIEDEILEIEQNQAELKQEALDAYVALEERTIAALEKIRQDEIESMQEGFEALTEAEEELADAISKSIDEMRQARENEKTEDEIAEKERRLAYLRQDTTGSNALEIKRLEEEIAEQRENYQDALIDQALENLQDQNELAAEQRDRQIELMESQLEHDIETGALAREATQLVEDALRDGVFTHDDALYGILSEGEGWPSKTEKMLEQILAELQEQFGKAAALDSMGQYTEEEFMNEIADQNYMQAMVDRYNSNGGVIDDYIRDLNDQRNAKINSGYYQGSQPPLYGDAAIEAEIKKKVGDQAAEDANAAEAEYRIYRFSSPMMLEDIAAETGSTVDRLLKANPGLSATEPVPAWKNVKVPLKEYKTGGLADFTGPAWLDGTKSKPELVLNARDTQNFIMLKDILSGILTNATPSKSSGGDNYFDIDITVEEISNDYDVDRMAERIKQNIYEDSMYRNVNAVNFLR